MHSPFSDQPTEFLEFAKTITALLLNHQSRRDQDRAG
jgi:hypothetical protein